GARAAGGGGGSELPPAAPGGGDLHARAHHAAGTQGSPGHDRGDPDRAARPAGAESRGHFPDAHRDRIGAALYLVGRSLLNATRRRVARLRQPKYLIGLVVGGLYFYSFFFRPRRGAGLGAIASPGGEIVAVGLVGALVLLKWLFGSAETPFTFSLAETQYLFTAPLTRRQVIDFKLVRSQLPLFISAVLSALVFSSGQVTGLRVFRVVGLWLVYSTLQLHYAGASLVWASLTQHGVTVLRRRLDARLRGGRGGARGQGGPADRGRAPGTVGGANPASPASDGPDPPAVGSDRRTGRCHPLEERRRSDSRLEPARARAGRRAGDRRRDGLRERAGARARSGGGDAVGARRRSLGARAGRGAVRPAPRPRDAGRAQGLPRARTRDG